MDYLASYSALPYFGNQQWLIGAVVPTADFTDDLWRAHIVTMLISLGILLSGVILVSLLISRVVRPLKKITREIRHIKNFHLEENKHIVSHIKEINYIGDALHSMKKGLRTFQRYVPAALVRQLIETGEDARLGGIKVPLAILFSDIKNFTAIAEEVDPDELTPHLCEYFDELSHIIVLNNGTIDKYIGDAIMAFWGAPSTIDDPCIYAAKAALRCIKRSAELNAHWSQTDKPIFYTRMGIHLGDAIVGNIGSAERLSYTAIGDATNTASRLENINKLYGTQIIVSESVYQEIKNYFVLRHVDLVSVKGKHEISNLYELIAETRAEVPYDLENYTQLFDQGFRAYQHSKWDEAIRLFKECLKINHKDTLALVFIQRCEKFKITPPDTAWDGIWHMGEK